MGTAVPINRRTPSKTNEELPHNLEAERAILGAILVDNSALKIAETYLQAIDFFHQHHKVIFETMLEMQTSHVPIDLVLLCDALMKTERLEAAGGAAYISQLSDGMPRISNVAHYAKRVKDKFLQRQFAYLGDELQQMAMAGSDPTDLENKLREYVRQQTVMNGNPAVVVGIRSLLTMNMPEMDFVFNPLLTIGGIGEIYGYRGSGKSLVATKEALDISSGAKLLWKHPRAGGNWPIPQRLSVLYIYGEMHGKMIQTRLQQMARGIGLETVPEDEWLGTMCRGFQRSWRPNIATPQNRRFIEDRIVKGNYKVVYLDNLSTLWPVSAEGEGQRTAVLNDWFMDLGQEGISIIYLHHAGKSGLQRGDSSKEDLLDFVRRLRRPDNGEHNGSLCVEDKIEKIRAECADPRWMQPFEISLSTAEDIATWSVRPAKDAQLSLAFEMFRNGMKPNDVFGELGIARSTAYRYKKSYDENSLVTHWVAPEEA